MIDVSKAIRVTSTNAGASTFQTNTMRKPIALKHPDGKPFKAGDTKAGQTIEIDPKTGIIYGVR